MKVKTFIVCGNDDSTFEKLDGLVNALNAKKIILITDDIIKRDIHHESYSEKYGGMESVFHKNISHTKRVVVYEDQSLGNPTA